MNEPIIIRLTPDIIEYADNIAALRQGTAFLKRRANANGLIGSFDQLLAIHRMGARCEAAGKLYMNPIRWHAFAGRIKGLPDLGDFIDVKGRSRASYDLPVQKDDEDDFAFLLITAESHPDYAIHGWAWGREAKNDQFWDDPKGGRPAYFMPQGALRDAEELRALVHGKTAEAEAAQEEMMEFARETLK
jgi:hypothetical protein